MSFILELSGIVTSLAAILGIIFTCWVWFKRLLDAQKCQLRHTMLSIYYKHCDNKKIRQYEYEHFVKTYEAYKALRGNSFIDKIYTEIKEYTVIS